MIIINQQRDNKMQLHDIVDEFRFNPSANTAMGLARELAKYPHLLWDVSEHTRERAAIYLNESTDTVYQHHASYLTALKPLITK